MSQFEVMFYDKARERSRHHHLSATVFCCLLRSRLPFLPSEVDTFQCSFNLLFILTYTLCLLMLRVMNSSGGVYIINYYYYYLLFTFNRSIIKCKRYITQRKTSVQKVIEWMCGWIQSCKDSFNHGGESKRLAAVPNFIVVSRCDRSLYF